MPVSTVQFKKMLRAINPVIELLKAADKEAKQTISQWISLSTIFCLKCNIKFVKLKNNGNCTLNVVCRDFVGIFFQKRR